MYCAQHMDVNDVALKFFEAQHRILLHRFSHPNIAMKNAMIGSTEVHSQTIWQQVVPNSQTHMT